MHSRFSQISGHKEKNLARLSKALCICVVLLAALSTEASAANLGAANDYGIFVFGNVNTTSDCQGRVAVGGDATFTGYSIAEYVTDYTVPSLVVGGDLSYTSGTIYGDSYVAGSINKFQYVTLQNGTMHNPAAVIDFAAARDYLTSTSAAWGSLSDSGSIDINQYSHNITLTANQAGLNVFNITADQLNACQGLTINAANAASTVLVNVIGKSKSVSGTDCWFHGGLSLTGTSANKVIYNFTDAENLTINGIGVEGTVFAPKAALAFSNGHINGSLIGASFEGSGQVNNYTFTGEVPTPEPSGLLVMSMGGALVAAFRMRRR